MFEQHRRNNWEMKMATVEQVYGKAAAMRLRTEKAVLEQFQRLPGLPSSRVGVDTLTGADEQIEFSDFLNGAAAFGPGRTGHVLTVTMVMAAQTPTSTRSTRSACTRPWRSSSPSSKRQTSCSSAQRYGELAVTRVANGIHLDLCLTDSSGFMPQLCVCVYLHASHVGHQVPNLRCVRFHALDVLTRHLPLAALLTR